MAATAEEPLDAHITALYAILVVLLVLGAGLMSGLTLGLLSLDVMDLEVLRVSGTTKQQSAASRLIPLVAKPHWLLCTLLLCNAACMEALPLFLDRLLNPVGAILLSVTAILMFGEIIPQAVCSRYGVAIGSALAPLVRVLMVLCAPITWPLGKLLDWTLGHETVTMKRQQLKAMVQLHGEGAGLGGKLTQQEVSVISGAIDLRYKTAISAMTPLPKVFMVSDQALLDEGLVRAMLHSGHSRVPVYRGNDVAEFAGLILVKEVLQFWRCPETPRVSQLSLRPLPRLPADTPMFDMLRFFQTGNSHMALLTAPEGSDLEEFKRTKAFMVTRDEDDTSSSSSSSSSSSHSTSDSCCSSDEEGGQGRSTAGSVSSSFKWRLGRHKSKRSSSDRRNSVEEGSKATSIAGSEFPCQQCVQLCSCPCHAHTACVCDTVSAVSEPLGSVAAMTSASLSPQVTAGTQVVVQGLCPLVLPGVGTGVGSVASSSGAAAGAVGSSIPSPSSSSSPMLQQPLAAPGSSYGSSSGGMQQAPLGPLHCYGATQGEHSSPLGQGFAQGSPTAASGAGRTVSMPANLQGVQLDTRCSPFEIVNMGLHESCICCKCMCHPPQPPSHMMQQQLSASVLSRVTPVSHPVALHHHHHHHHEHQNHHQQQQQESGTLPAAEQQTGSGHIALTVSAVEHAQSQQSHQQQQNSGTPSMLQHASSGSSGSGRQPGSVSTTPASAGHSAAAAAAAAAGGGACGGSGSPATVPAATAGDDDIAPAGSAGPAVGADEQQDQLGPLVRHSRSSPHWGAGHSSTAAVVSAVPRQMPVGIITLEDVIEELMQAEIVDETDAYMDNDKTKRVDLHQLMESLPPTMLTTLRAEMLQAAQNFIKHAAWTPGAALNPNNVRQLTAIRAVAAAAAGGVAAPPPGAVPGVAGGSSAGGAQHSGAGLGSPYTGYNLSPGSGGLGLNLGVAVGASPAAAAAAVVAPGATSAAAAAAVALALDSSNHGRQHWADFGSEGVRRDTAGQVDTTGRLSGAYAGATGRASATGCNRDDADDTAVAGQGQSSMRLRVSSSPAAAGPASGGAVPIPTGGHAGSSGGGGSNRVSAPGVLSRSPAAAGGKPLNKVFKSTPSQLLAPGSAGGGAGISPGPGQPLSPPPACPPARGI